MAKTVSAALQTHKALDVTAFATAWQITRLDGVIQRFANGSRDVFLDIGDSLGSQFYSAKEGFARTNIANDAELNVGNLEVVGIFSGASLDETELRRGLYDFADVKIMTYNQKGPTDGIIKMLRGQMAQVIVSTKGFFKVELRDLTQVFSYELGEAYSRDCRADLGDSRCRAPIWPAILPYNTEVTAGSFHSIQIDPDPTGCSQVIMNFEGADNATSGPGFDNTGTEPGPTHILSGAKIDDDIQPAGGDSTSSLFLDGINDRVEWTRRTAWHIDTNPCTIAAWIRPRIDQPAFGAISSVYSSNGSNRAWFLRHNDDIIDAVIYQSDGVTVDVTLTGTTIITPGTDYHVELARKENGDWVLFLDGAIEAGPTTPTDDVAHVVSPLRIGAVDVAAAGAWYFDGHIDSYMFMNGRVLHETAFTPVAGNIIAPDPDTVFTSAEIGEVVYEVTTAGLTGPCHIVPDQTITNTHSQGTAVMTARNSFMRSATVSAVGSEPRRQFTVTELTPNTGYTISGGTPTALGFEDNFFEFGGCTFETGNNAGRGKEVRVFTADDGVTIEQVIELFEPMPFDIEVGDTLRIFPGCDKLHTTCFTKFDNATNFVGEPFVPGADTLGTYPDAH